MTELIVRSAPGTGPDSDIYPGRLDQGKRLWLYDGPVASAGYQWFLVVAEEGSWLDASLSVRSGWVAAASREGEPWIRTIAPTCPAEISLESVGSLSSGERVLCLGDQSITVEGWVPPVLGSGGCGGEQPGWLTCFLGETKLLSVEPPAAAFTGGAPGWDEGAVRLSVNHPPGSSSPAVAAGTRLRVVGHVDDPAAAECGVSGFPDATITIPEPSLIYYCRGEFVADMITVLD